MHFEIRWI